MDDRDFATLGTNDSFTPNLHEYFLQRARDVFEELNGGKYPDPGNWVPRAAGVVADAGTSLAILLGQSYHRVEDERGKGNVLPLLELWKRVAGRNKDLDDRVKELVLSYDAVRHFGQPKHPRIREYLWEADDYLATLADFLRTVQEVRRVVEADSTRRRRPSSAGKGEPTSSEP